MFHGNLVHASAPNITPYPRRIVYLTLCAVSNYIRKPTRPEWIAHRDFSPIEPVDDGALLAYARAHHPLPNPPPLAGEGRVGVAVQAAASPA
jgi:ectoine hydroxylase